MILIKYVEFEIQKNNNHQKTRNFRLSYQSF